jgi:hypothetical protein
MVDILEELLNDLLPQRRKPGACVLGPAQKQDHVQRQRFKPSKRRVRHVPFRKNHSPPRRRHDRLIGADQDRFAHLALAPEKF